LVLVSGVLFDAEPLAVGKLRPVAFERGEGDSVKEIKRFWRGKSLDEIYRMVKREKITP
jgi:hypothetical protein